MKSRSAEKVKLNSFDGLFGIDETGETVTSVPLSELHTFRDHPFRVLDDEKMQEIVESVKQYGVLMPGIVRPHPERGYEVIAGHGRWRACELAGLTEMPVIIREMDDDTAVVLMVDTNIQREDILPSEKAKAYRMKYMALRHRGKKSGKNTYDEIGEAAGENAKKVQRYIWLSRLSEGLLEMVDRKELGISQGVDLSFLTEEAQQWVQSVIKEKNCTVSIAQSARIKEYAKKDELTLAIVQLVLEEAKQKKRKITLKAERINRYFAEDLSSEEIESIIIQLLEEWKDGNRRDV